MGKLFYMICFDLEGPLSPQDNAYEVMRLAENGGAVFEALSEYDDILALENREGYEPGDTLKLIVPFLQYYGITENDIKNVSKTAVLVNGMDTTIDWIIDEGIPVRIISTSYEQHAYSIGERLKIPPSDIASTRLNLADLLDEEIVLRLKQIEKEILSKGLSEKCVKLLDTLYFSYGLFNKIKIRVVGGQRKVDALLNFAKDQGVDIENVIAIGDSITDFKMLREVSKGGGLSIAFNANQYCLPYANVSLATLDGRALIPILNEFFKEGKSAALTLTEKFEKTPDQMNDYPVLQKLDAPPSFSIIPKSGDIRSILPIHTDMRMKVRGEAGKLG